MGGRKRVGGLYVCGLMCDIHKGCVIVVGERREERASEEVEQFLMPRMLETRFGLAWLAGHGTACTSPVVSCGCAYGAGCLLFLVCVCIGGCAAELGCGDRPTFACHSRYCDLRQAKSFNVVAAVNGLRS